MSRPPCSAAVDLNELTFYVTSIACPNCGQRTVRAAPCGRDAKQRLCSFPDRHLHTICSTCSLGYHVPGWMDLPYTEKGHLRPVKVKALTPTRQAYIPTQRIPIGEHPGNQKPSRLNIEHGWTE